MSDEVQGRELDALVAQKVMGEVCNCDGTTRNNPYKMPSFCPIHGVTNRGALKHYSTDISAAMEVVEKVAAPGIHFMSDYLVQRNGERRWFAQFLRDGLTNGLHNKWIEAPTLPHAICRAALAAIGDEDAENN